MNNTTTAEERKTAETMSEYKIGHTTYTVKTVFNPAFRESLSDILKRLMLRECEDFIGETEQETEKQAV